MKNNSLRNNILFNIKGAGVCLGSFLLLLLSVEAHSAILTVGKGKNFDTIQKAVKKAKKSDVIKVSEGSYQESLVIDKEITLIGEGRPVINGGGKGKVVLIKAANVIIEGFKVQESGDDLSEKDSGIYVEGEATGTVIRNNIVEKSAFAIWINGTHDVKIIKNHVIGKRELPTAKRGNGIHVWNVRNGLFEGNEVEGARDGIFVDWTEDSVFKNNKIYDLRYGFHYMFSHKNRLEGNITFNNRAGLALMYSNNQEIISNQSYDNDYHGIMMQTMRNCKVINNVVSNTEKGMFIYDSQYNEVKGNIIADADIGVHIWAGSVDNKFTGNSFIHNRSQIKYVGAKDQEWSEEKRGNYWSDYLGWDIDGDSMGDVPHVANTLMERLIWSYPVIKLLFNSPAVQTLRMVESQFPVLRAPGVIDSFPLMKPAQEDWNRWVGRGVNRPGESEASSGLEMM